MKRYDLKAFLKDGNLVRVGRSKRWRDPKALFINGIGTLPAVPLFVLTFIDPSTAQHLQSTLPMA